MCAFNHWCPFFLRAMVPCLLDVLTSNRRHPFQVENSSELKSLGTPSHYVILTQTKVKGHYTDAQITKLHCTDVLFLARWFYVVLQHLGNRFGVINESGGPSRTHTAWKMMISSD